jgi:twitching motility protein PilT
MAQQTQLKIELLLEEVVKTKASDLHLQVALPPMLRVDGGLRPVTGSPVLNEQNVENLIFAILDDEQKQILLKDKEFDFSFAFGDLGRFRVNAFHERGNLAAALRLIPNEILTIEQLGLPKIVEKFADYPRGLVLVTGPTGSGKSTTLYAVIQEIKNVAINIITLEDPVEYKIDGINQIQVNPAVGLTFASGLRSILRQDPNVIMVGEIRDHETADLAVQAALTGHIVLSTLHSVFTTLPYISLTPSSEKLRLSADTTGELTK